jgi:hypothetical protein
MSTRACSYSVYSLLYRGLKSSLNHSALLCPCPQCRSNINKAAITRSTTQRLPIWPTHLCPNPRPIPAEVYLINAGQVGRTCKAHIIYCCGRNRRHSGTQTPKQRTVLGPWGPALGERVVRARGLQRPARGDGNQLVSGPLPLRSQVATAPGTSANRTWQECGVLHPRLAGSVWRRQRPTPPHSPSIRAVPSGLRQRCVRRRMDGTAVLLYHRHQHLCVVYQRTGRICSRGIQWCYRPL